MTLRLSSIAHLVAPLLLFGSATGEDNALSLGLTAEWIEVDLAVLPALLAKHGGEFDAGGLHEAVTALIDEGKAERKEIVYGRGDFGTRMKIESIDEKIYPTEYDPPEIPNTVTISNTSADVVPRTGATPTAFETRNVGVTVEAEPVQTESGLIHLTLAAEEVDDLGRDFHAEPDTPDTEGLRGLWMPKFFTMRVATSLHLRPGGTALVGTFKQSEPDKNAKRLILFIHAQLIAGKAAE